MALVTCGPCTARYPDDVGACPNCGSTAQQAAGSVVPSVTVACLTDYCPARGVERRIMLRTAALGVLERPTLVCASCRCLLPELTEDHDMAKITVHGGASNAYAEPTEGGEESSPGSSSPTSSEKPKTSPETSETVSPLPVRTTGSRSRRGRTAASTVPSTDGDQTEPMSDSDEGGTP
jgi:hypothetical protein